MIRLTKNLILAVRGSLVALAMLVAMVGTAKAQLVFATFDAAQFDVNGFRFADFDDDFFNTAGTSGGLINIDINTDIDLSNGLFGGMGSDVSADFIDTTTQLEVTFQVGADNAAGDFRIVLIDSDGDDSGPGLGTEEFQYFVDISTLSPADGFVTVTQPLSSFIFRQQGFGSTNDGDMLTNFGLQQIQIQSAFGGTDRLQIDVESVQLVDPLGEPDPLIVELTPDTFASQPQDFAFGTFEDPSNPGQLNPAVVDTTGGTFAINTTQLANDGDPGGLGFNGLNFDFEATEVMIELEARLLPGNTADTINLLMGDLDGDDSGPGLGSEDYIFSVPTSEFNETEFTTFQLPLGSGTESGIETTFAFNNGGDGLQNFDLTQLQIQVDAESEISDGSGLAIEIARFSIVAFEGFAGDFNDDGVVDAADYTVWRDALAANPNDDSPLNGAGNGDGVIDIQDYDLWVNNFGSGSSVATSIPEPAAISLAVLLIGLGVVRRSYCR